jgi:hypothetical protein
MDPESRSTCKIELIFHATSRLPKPPYHISQREEVDFRGSDAYAAAIED